MTDVQHHVPEGEQQKEHAAGDGASRFLPSRRRLRSIRDAAFRLETEHDGAGQQKKKGKGHAEGNEVADVGRIPVMRVRPCRERRVDKRQCLASALRAEREKQECRRTARKNCPERVLPHRERPASGEAAETAAPVKGASKRGIAGKARHALMAPGKMKDKENEFLFHLT